MKETQTPLDVLAEEAEQVNAIEGEADARQPGQPDQQAAPAAISNSQAVAGALAAGREAFCFFTKLQSPRRVLNDDRVQQLAALAAPVLEKHGIDLGQYIGDMGAELALAAGVFAVAIELRQACSAELASKEDQTEADIAPQTVSDGQ